MTVAPNPVLIHRSRLPFRYPRRSLLRWYGPAANTSASSASANFNITSPPLPRNASLNRSGPKRPSIWLKHCILFPIGVFLLGLTLPMSQILFWDTERIRLLYFPQQAGRRPILRLGALFFNHPKCIGPAVLSDDDARVSHGPRALQLVRRNAMPLSRHRKCCGERHYSIIGSSGGLRRIVCVCSQYFLVWAKMKYFGGQATRTLVIKSDTVDPDQGCNQFKPEIRNE